LRCAAAVPQFGYLALSQALDNREMLPPPPEALGL
jgi:hypothetical protein